LTKTLVEDFGKFLAAQWAAVTEFAQTSLLDDLSNLGSGSIFKFGGCNGDLRVEEGQDFVLVRDGTSSHVTDETSVALSGSDWVKTAKAASSLLASADLFPRRRAAPMTRPLRMIPAPRAKTPMVPPRERVVAVPKVTVEPAAAVVPRMMVP